MDSFHDVTDHAVVPHGESVTYNGADSLMDIECMVLKPQQGCPGDKLTLDLTGKFKLTLHCVLLFSLR